MTTDGAPDNASESVTRRMPRLIVTAPPMALLPLAVRVAAPSAMEVPVMLMVPPLRPGLVPDDVPPLADTLPARLTLPLAFRVTLPAFVLAAPVALMVPAAVLVMLAASSRTPPEADRAAFTEMVLPSSRRTLLPAAIASALATVMFRVACRYSSL